MSTAPTFHRVSRSRLPKALGIALAVQLTLTVFTGLAAAPSLAADALPAEFSVPEVREGDVAVYEVRSPDGGEAASLHDRPIEQVALEWKGPAWTYTHDGSAEPVARMKLYFQLGDPTAAPSAEGSSRDSTTQDHAFDARLKVHYNLTTWRSEATTGYEVGEMTTRHVDSVDEEAATSKRYDVYYSELLDPTTPCGFHLPIHGEAVSLSQPLVQAGDCGGPNGTLSATAIVRASGVQALQLASGGERPVEVAYAPGTSVPVAWRGPLSRLGLKGETNVSLELSAYERGRGKAPSVPGEPRPDPFSVPLAEPEPWGPRERNLEDVAFPLSEAYQVLMDQSGEAQAFVEDHPNAYTARAWMFKDRDAADRPRTNWQIVLTDGTDTLERFVSRSDPLRVPGTGLQADPPERIQTRDDRSVPPTIPEPRDRYPSPELQAHELPVVGTAGLSDEANGGYAPWETPHPRHYGVSVACEDHACQAARSIVEVGARPPDGDGPARSALPWEQKLGTVAFGLDAQGDLVYVQGKAERWTGNALNPRGAQRGPPSPTEEVDAGAWAFPSPEATLGATILALLSGAAYYFWPKLKLFGLALYSRIGNDPEDVLESGTRRQIHELIGEEPGIHFNELRRRLATGRGVLDHHLDRLTAAGLIVEHEGDGYTCYFQAGSTEVEVRNVADRVRARGARELVAKLRHAPGASVTELAQAAGVARSTASYHIDRLAEAGLVERKPDGNAQAISLTDLGHRAVQRLGLA